MSQIRPILTHQTYNSNTVTKLDSLGNPEEASFKSSLNNGIERNVIRQWSLPVSVQLHCTREVYCIHFTGSVVQSVWSISVIIINIIIIIIIII